MHIAPERVSIGFEMVILFARHTWESQLDVVHVARRVSLPPTQSEKCWNTGRPKLFKQLESVWKTVTQNRKKLIWTWNLFSHSNPALGTLTF